jgi:MFS family permease
MRAIISSIGPLLAGIILLTFGVGLLGTLLGVRMAEAAFSPLTAGLVMAGYFVGQFAGSAVVQRWIETVGHIRTYTAFTAILSAATLAHPFALDTGLWTLLRFLQGFCMAGLLLCVESWLNTRATRETRGTILAVYMIVFYGAYGLGQFLLYIPDVSGFALYIVASILVSIAAVPIALTRIEAPEIRRSSRLQLGRLYEISPTGVVGSLMSGVILGAFFGLAPYYATAIGLDAGQAGMMMTAAIFGGLVMQFPIGRLSDRFDRRKVIAAVSLCIAVIAGAIAVFGAVSYPLLLVLAAVFGGFSFTLYPLSAANANDYADPADAVATGRGLLVSYSGGAIVGPLGSAILIYAVAPGGLFLFMGVIAFATFVFVMLRMQSREAAPAEDQAPFQALPRTTPEILALDPRTDPEAVSDEAA